jgi:DDE superfamily endonuclease
LVAAAIPTAAHGRPIELWLQNEARVGQQRSLTRISAQRGSRRPALRDQRYEWAYLFGAVCPARGVGAGLVLVHANVDAMNRHLQEVSRWVTPGASAVLTLDGAGWHRKGGHLVVPDNIGLLKLPPYSPELNPVDRWLRGRAIRPAHPDHAGSSDNAVSRGLTWVSGRQRSPGSRLD